MRLVIQMCLLPAGVYAGVSGSIIVRLLNAIIQHGCRQISLSERRCGSLEFESLRV